MIINDSTSSSSVLSVIMSKMYDLRLILYYKKNVVIGSIIKGVLGKFLIEAGLS